MNLLKVQFVVKFEIKEKKEIFMLCEIFLIIRLS